MPGSVALALIWDTVALWYSLLRIVLSFVALYFQSIGHVIPKPPI